MKDQYVTRELGQTIIKGLPPSKRVSFTQALQAEYCLQTCRLITLPISLIIAGVKNKK